MGKYNFDEVIDRHGTDCLKYDFGMKRKGRDDLLPLWVADMDFRLPDEILDEFHKRIDHGIFGYTDPLDEYFAQQAKAHESESASPLGSSILVYKEKGRTMHV